MRAWALGLLLASARTSAEPSVPVECSADTHLRSTSGDTLKQEWCERGDGTRHGLYRSSSGGMRSTEGRYVDGKEDGLWMSWWPDGRPSQELHYERGIRHGAWVAWDSRGAPTVRGAYRHGKEDGTWTWWHPGGRKKATATFVNGRKQGRETEWDEDGTVTSDGQHVDDQRVGHWIVGDDRGTYCADQRCGHWEVVQNRQLVAAGDYRADLRAGVWTTWLGNRRESRAMYVRGQKHGRFERWDIETGRKITEIECVRGIPHGLRREWWTTGQLRIAGRYDRGKLDGVWTVNETGTSPRRAVYDHGKHVSGDFVEPDEGAGFEPDGYGGDNECRADILEHDGLPDNH